MLSSLFVNGFFLKIKKKNVFNRLPKLKKKIVSNIIPLVTDSGAQNKQGFTHHYNETLSSYLPCAPSECKLETMYNRHYDAT